MESLLLLANQLIRLVSTHKQNRKGMFENIAEPLFIRMQPVVDDYFTMFRETRALLMTKGRHDLSHDLQSIINRREHMLQQRVVVREMARAIEAHIKDRRLTAYADKILHFFYSTNVVKRDTPSRGQEMVEILNYVEDGPLFRESLIEYINKALANFEESWVAIAQSYAALRIYCLAPRS